MAKNTYNNSKDIIVRVPEEEISKLEAEKQQIQEKLNDAKSELEKSKKSLEEQIKNDLIQWLNFIMSYVIQNNAKRFLAFSDVFKIDLKKRTDNALKSFHLNLSTTNTRVELQSCITNIVREIYKITLKSELYAKNIIAEDLIQIDLTSSYYEEEEVKDAVVAFTKEEERLLGVVEFNESQVIQYSKKINVIDNILLPEKALQQWEQL